MSYPGPPLKLMALQTTSTSNCYQQVSNLRLKANAMANALNKSLDSSSLPESLGSATTAAVPSSTPSVKATNPTSPSKLGVKSSLSISSAVDKLSRSLSGSSRTRIESSPGPSVSGTGTGTPARGHRRIFSINRKGKGKEKAGGGELRPGSQLPY